MQCLPFKALRPNQDKIEKVNVPPYDVVNREEASLFAKNNPDSFFHITRADIDRQDLDEHDPEVYKEARKNLEDFIKRGTLIRDNENHYYIYQQNWMGTERTGVFARVSIDEYDNNTIKKHELTRPDKEDDRTTLLKTVKANTGPVFLLFKDKEGFEQICNEIKKQKPLYHFYDENGVENIVWKSEKEATKKLREYFNATDAFYIADGHHRAASASRTREYFRANNPNHRGDEPYNYFLAAVFPASSLKIIAYNRAIHKLNGMSDEEFLNKIKESFHVEKCDKVQPETRGEIILYLKSGKYTLKAREEILNKDNIIDTLDVAILQKYIFENILDIHNIRTSTNISFVGGVNSCEKLQQMIHDGKAEAAFSLYPVSIDDLIKISDQNKIMPPKSTWFEPKLRSGIVIHEL